MLFEALFFKNSLGDLGELWDGCDLNFWRTHRFTRTCHVWYVGVVLLDQAGQ